MQSHQLSLLARTYVVATATLGLSGCGFNYIHLHDTANHELAQKALASFAEAHLGDAVGEERKRSQLILEREVAALRRHSLAARDSMLMSFLNRSSVAVAMQHLSGDATIRAETITDLGDSPKPDAARKVRRLWETLRDEQIELGTRYGALRMSGWPANIPIGCPLAKSAATSPLLRAAIQGVEVQCKSVVTARAKFDEAVKGGSLRQTLDRLAEVEQQRAELRKILENQEQEYSSKRKTYQDELGNASKEQKQIDKLAEDVKKALDTIGKVTCPMPEASKAPPLVAGANAPAETDPADCAGAPAAVVLQQLGFGDLALEGKLAKLEEERRLLLTLVLALIQSKGGADAKTVDGVDQTLLAVMTRFRDLHTATRFPRVNQILLEIERLNIEIERTRRAIARADASLQLEEARRDAQIAELSYLAEAVESASNAKASCGGSKFDTFQSAGPGCRSDAARALVSYASAWTVGRTIDGEIELQQLGLQHDGALDTSELAILGWQKLIEIPLAQLEVYHAGGIRAEDIGNLIQALGFSAVAVGVN